MEMIVVCIVRSEMQAGIENIPAPLYLKEIIWFI